MSRQLENRKHGKSELQTNESELSIWENPKVSYSEYVNSKDLLINKFKLSQKGKLNSTPDEEFCDYRTKDFSISIEWDIWSGMIIQAKNNKSNKFVDSIAEFLNNN